MPDRCDQIQDKLNPIHGSQGMLAFIGWRDLGQIFDLDDFLHDK